ncbi:MAG: hypothetical protein PHS37_06525 [Candidatus Omnitrophica bacterium]|nr:hypothetical protein [Candidatus Omnitrophota bacterium]
MAWPEFESFHLSPQSVFKPITRDAIRDIGIIKFYLTCLSKSVDLKTLERDVNALIPGENIDVSLRFTAKGDPAFQSLLAGRPDESIVPCSVNKTAYYAHVVFAGEKSPPQVVIFTAAEFERILDKGIVPSPALLSRPEKTAKDIEHEENIDTPLALIHGTSPHMVQKVKLYATLAVFDFLKHFGADKNLIEDFRTMINEQKITIVPGAIKVIVRIGGEETTIPVALKDAHVSNRFINIPTSVNAELGGILIHELGARCGQGHMVNRDLQVAFRIWLTATRQLLHFDRKLYPVLEKVPSLVFAEDLTELEERDFREGTEQRPRSVLMGKYVIVGDVSFVPDGTTGRLKAKFDAWDIVAEKRQTITLYGRPGDVTAFTGFRRTGIPEIDDALTRYVSGPAQYIVLEPNSYGIEGLGTTSAFAVTERFMGNDIALFHEAAHGVIDREFREGTVSPVLESIVGQLTYKGKAGEEALEVYLEEKAVKYRVPAAGRKKWKQALGEHYALRLFQRQMWGADDQRLSALSKVSYQRLDDLAFQKVGAGEDSVAHVPAALAKDAAGERIFARTYLMQHQWWFFSGWTKKGIPREQVTLTVAGHTIDIYSWRHEKLAQEEIATIERSLARFAGVFGGFVLRKCRYILVNDVPDKKQLVTGEPTNGQTFYDMEAIVLYPAAFKKEPFRIDAIKNNLEGAMLHELGHVMEHYVINGTMYLKQWEKKFGWDGGLVQSPERCITAYAGTSAPEDLADSTAAFLKDVKYLDRGRRNFLGKAFGQEAQVSIGQAVRREGSDMVLPRLSSPVTYTCVGNQKPETRGIPLSLWLLLKTERRLRAMPYFARRMYRQLDAWSGYRLPGIFAFRERLGRKITAIIRKDGRYASEGLLGMVLCADDCDYAGSSMMKAVRLFADINPAAFSSRNLKIFLRRYASERLGSSATTVIQLFVEINPEAFLDAKVVSRIFDMFKRDQMAASLVLGILEKIAPAAFNQENFQKALSLLDSKDASRHAESILEVFAKTNPALFHSRNLIRVLGHGTNSGLAQGQSVLAVVRVFGRVNPAAFTGTAFKYFLNVVRRGGLVYERNAYYVAHEFIYANPHVITAGTYARFLRLDLDTHFGRLAGNDQADGFLRASMVEDLRPLFVNAPDKALTAGRLEVLIREAVITGSFKARPLLDHHLQLFVRAQDPGIFSQGLFDRLVSWAGAGDHNVSQKAYALMPQFLKSNPGLRTAGNVKKLLELDKARPLLPLALRGTFPVSFDLFAGGPVTEDIDVFNDENFALVRGMMEHREPAVRIDGFIAAQSFIRNSPRYQNEKTLRLLLGYFKTMAHGAWDHNDVMAALLDAFRAFGPDKPGIFTEAALADFLKYVTGPDGSFTSQAVEDVDKLFLIFIAGNKAAFSDANLKDVLGVFEKRHWQDVAVRTENEAELMTVLQVLSAFAKARPGTRADEGLEAIFTVDNFNVLFTVFKKILDRINAIRQEDGFGRRPLVSYYVYLHYLARAFSMFIDRNNAVMTPEFVATVAGLGTDMAFELKDDMCLLLSQMLGSLTGQAERSTVESVLEAAHVRMAEQLGQSIHRQYPHLGVSAASVGIIEEICGKQAMSDLSVGGQQLVRLRIMSRVIDAEGKLPAGRHMTGKDKERTVKEFQEKVVPSIRLVEELYKNTNPVGIEIHVRTAEFSPAELDRMKDFFGYGLLIPSKTIIRDLEIDKGHLELRIHPGYYPILMACIEEYIRMGALKPSPKAWWTLASNGTERNVDLLPNHHLSIQGMLGADAIWLVSLGYNLGVTLAEPETLKKRQEEREGGAAGSDVPFPGIYNYAGVTYAVKTTGTLAAGRKLDCGQTNIYDQGALGGRFVDDGTMVRFYREDIRTKALLASLILAHDDSYGYMDPAVRAKLKPLYEKFKGDLRSCLEKVMGLHKPGIAGEAAQEINEKIDVIMGATYSFRRDPVYATHYDGKYLLNAVQYLWDAIRADETHRGWKLLVKLLIDERARIKEALFNGGAERTIVTMAEELTTSGDFGAVMDYLVRLNEDTETKDEAQRLLRIAGGPLAEKILKAEDAIKAAAQTVEDRDREQRKAEVEEKERAGAVQTQDRGSATVQRYGTKNEQCAKDLVTALQDLALSAGPDEKIVFALDKALGRDSARKFVQEVIRDLVEKTRDERIRALLNNLIIVEGRNQNLVRQVTAMVSSGTVKPENVIMVTTVANQEDCRSLDKAVITFVDDTRISISDYYALPQVILFTLSKVLYVRGAGRYADEQRFSELYTWFAKDVPPVKDIIDRCVRAKQFVLKLEPIEKIDTADLERIYRSFREFLEKA